MSDTLEVITLKKLSQQDRKEIVISHYLNNSKENISYLMNKYNISKTALYDVINHKESSEYIKEYQPNLTKKFETIINKALEKLDYSVNSEDIKPLDLVKIIGILYDKSRLENNLSTENKSINININIEK